MAKGQFLFNAVAEGYARQPIADPVSYERKLEITRKYLQPQHRVFEFGCGHRVDRTAARPLREPYSGD
jgi:hypothetical protein